MNKLTIDVGIKEFEVNGKEILRFNPSDPNLYDRFLAMTNKISDIERDFMAEAESFEDDEQRAEKLVVLMGRYDAMLKTELNTVFGAENDFDRILEGVSLLAVTSTGRVVTNLINALSPILEKGASKHIENSAAEAVITAKRNREQRRALEK